MSDDVDVAVLGTGIEVSADLVEAIIEVFSNTRSASSTSVALEDVEVDENGLQATAHVGTSIGRGKIRLYEATFDEEGILVSLTLEEVTADE